MEKIEKRKSKIYWRKNEERGNKEKILKQKTYRNVLLDITFFINYLFDTYINDFRIVLILWIIFKAINFICYIYYFLFLLCVEIFIKNEKIKIIIEKISTYLYFIVSIKILFFIYKMYFLPVG